MKKFKTVALGCRTNQYESEAFKTQLTELGLEAAKDGEKADVCIINTCTVTASADSNSRHEIREMIRKNAGAKIVVTGCFAERDPAAVLSIEGVTAVIPNKDKEALVATLFPEEDVPEFSIKHFEAHTRAFVKVQDGCNSFCTYCIIPYVRGRSRSRSVAEILEEVKQLVANGYKEIVLTGINIGDFDGNETPKRKLAELVRQVDEIPGVERLRISSIDPDEIDDELLEAVVKGKNTCHSMHIVLQAGSNVILRRMNRKYTRQIFMETVDRLKNASADFTFTTDIIVGFPGETDVDFDETLAVMREVQFAKVHMFPYSDRPRTRSSLYPNKVASEVIAKRKAKLLQEAEELSFQLRERYVGQRAVVLTEENGKGHTANFLPVILNESHIPPNKLVEVTLTANTAEGLVGHAS